jgi:AcrR family transcriptional regulator
VADDPPARRQRAGAADADTRGRILDAAQKLFAARGYAATTTKSIAEAAGVATGLVFYHFPSKQRLLEELLEERSFVPEMRAILKDADAAGPRETLLTVARRFVALFAEHHDVLRIVIQTRVTGGEAPADFDRSIRGEIDALADYLVAAVGDDRLNRPRAVALTRALLSSLVMTITILPIEGDLDALIVDLVDVLLSGYDEPPPPAASS